jgi:bla regulator protein BlaR1
MNAAVAGWLVVHSLWQWTLIAGVAALVLGLLPDRSARARYRVAYAGVGLMLAVSLMTVLTANSRELSAVPRSLVYAFDGALIMPTVFDWGTGLLRVAATLWVAAMIVQAIRIGFEWRRARHLRQTGLGDPEAPIRSQLDELRREMSIAVNVEAYLSAHAHVPMLIGWRRPVIVLPAGSIGQLDAGQMRAVLAHELAHVQRGDYVMNLLQVMADAIVAYHPAARWLSRRVRIEREYCCDDVAIAMTGDPSAYASALADLEDTRSHCPLAVAAASGTLLDRIQRVVGVPRPTLSVTRGLLACTAAIALSAAILAMAINVPPPWLPAGSRMRRPGPPPVGTITAPGKQALKRTR